MIDGAFTLGELQAGGMVTPLFDEELQFEGTTIVDAAPDLSDATVTCRTS